MFETSFVQSVAENWMVAREGGDVDGVDESEEKKSLYTGDRKPLSTFVSVLVISAGVALLLSGVLVGTAAAEEISNANDLQGVSTSGDYVLTDDIDLSEVSDFEPIGDKGSPFTGTFDGDGHTITGLTIDRPKENNVGLFGAVGSEGRVEQVRLEGVNVKGDGRVGALVGYNEGEVNRTSVTGSTGATEGVKGNWSTGGLVGSNVGNITESYSEASVKDARTDAGGLVGVNLVGDISKSYATGSVTSDGKAGGLVGVNFEGSIDETYAAGSVSGGDETGGLVGNGTGTVSSSYWDTEETGQSSSDGGEGLTTNEMRGDAAKDNMAGFDFADTWSTVTDPDGYPVLVQEPEILSADHTVAGGRGDVPETDESVKVTAEIENVDSSSTVELRYTVNGDDKIPLDMTERPLNTWTATIPSGDHKTGNEIDYKVVAENRAGRDVSDSTLRTRYYSFDNVDDVAVLYANYTDGNPAPVGRSLQILQEQTETLVNEYYASGTGAMGAIGFDMKFYDNDGQWYNIGKDSQFYDNINDEWDSREAFVDNATSAVDSAEPSFDPRSYEAAIGISPPDPDPSSISGLDRASAFYAENIIGLNDPDKPDKVYIDSKESLPGVWVHELGHTIGSRDFYEGTDTPPGKIGITGVMGSGSDFPPRAPFTSVARTDYNVNDDDDSISWLDRRVKDGFREYEIKELRSKEPGDDVLDYEAKAGVLTKNANFVIEGRSLCCAATSPDFQEGIYIYQVITPIGGIGDREVRFIPSGPEPWDEATLSMESGTPTEITYLSPIPDVFAKFTLKDERNSGKDYEADVEISDPDGVGGRTVGAAISRLPSIPNPRATEALPNRTTPDLDLHAYDSQGRHVGKNYETGEYEMEIPGARTSGDRQGGIEWISVPSNVSVEYRMNSRDVARWIEEENVPDSVNKTSFYAFSRTRYGDNPHTEVIDGERVIVNSTTVASDAQAIEPGEVKITSVPAEVNFEPDPLNKRSGGRWVKANVTIPNEEVGVEQVNLSTVELNGEVEAVDDDRFGFVRNPVENGTLEVRFPRDEVSELLETGDEVRVTITGTTEDDVIIAGSDEIRVIDPGRGSGGDGGGAPGGGPSGGPPGGDESENTTESGGSDDSQGGPSGGNPGGGPASFDSGGGKGPATQAYSDDHRTETELMYLPVDGSTGHANGAKLLSFETDADTTEVERQMTTSASGSVPEEVTFKVDTNTNPTRVNLTRTDSGIPEVKKENLSLRVNYAKEGELQSEDFEGSDIDLSGEDEVWDKDEGIEAEVSSVERGQNVFVQLFYQPSGTTLIDSELLVIEGDGWLVEYPDTNFSVSASAPPSSGARDRDVDAVTYTPTKVVGDPPEDVTEPFILEGEVTKWNVSDISDPPDGPLPPQTPLRFRFEPPEGGFSTNLYSALPDRNVVSFDEVGETEVIVPKGDAKSFAVKIDPGGKASIEDSLSVRVMELANVPLSFTDRKKDPTENMTVRFSVSVLRICFINLGGCNSEVGQSGEIELRNVRAHSVGFDTNSSTGDDSS